MSLQDQWVEINRQTADSLADSVVSNSYTHECIRCTKVCFRRWTVFDATSTSYANSSVRRFLLMASKCVACQLTSDQALPKVDIQRK